MKSMKRLYLVTSITLLLLAAFVGRESILLKYYTNLGPGPGFFPVWLSVFLAVLAGTMLFHASFNRQEPVPDDFYPDKVGYLRVGALILAVAWCVVMLDNLGYRLTMLVFYPFLLFTLGKPNPILAILITLAGSWGLYQVFVNYLKVFLPIGIFGI